MSTAARRACSAPPTGTPTMRSAIRCFSTIFRVGCCGPRGVWRNNPRSRHLAPRLSRGTGGEIRFPQVHLSYIGRHQWIVNAFHARKLEIVETQLLHSINKNNGSKIISSETETHVFESELLDVAGVNTPR